MGTCSRRTFLTSLGVAAAAPLSALQRDPPGLVLHGGRLLTMNVAEPAAEAVAVTGERIVAVGTSRDLLALAGPRTVRIDLGGRTVVPGFIDAHSHPASAGRQHLREVDCDLRSIADIQAAIRTRAAATPKGAVGSRIQVRRHEDAGGAAGDPRRSRRRRAGPPGPDRPSRRTPGGTRVIGSSAARS